MKKINIQNANIIPILNNILYNPSTFEFLSELIFRSKIYFEDNNVRKEIIISIIDFIIISNKVIVEKVDISNRKSIIKKFDATNHQELTKIIDEEWVKFNDSNEINLWYSYQIRYTKSWINELKKLKIWNINKP